MYAGRWKAAASYHNMAYNLYMQGKFAEAQERYQKAFDIRRELFGARHADTAASYKNLVLILTQRINQAEKTKT